VEHLITRKLLAFSYLQMGIFESFGAFMTYFIIMSDFGFPFTTTIGLSTFHGYHYNTGDIYNSQDPYFGNTALKNAGVCDNGVDGIGAGTAPGNYGPDWIFSGDVSTDLRMVFVKCARDFTGQLTGGLASSITWGTCQTPQISGFNHIPVCYTPNVIRYAQTGYFASCVVCQWAKFIG